MRTFCGLLCVFGAFSILCAAQTPKYPFQDPRLPEAQRIDSLLHELTLDEKMSLFGDTLYIPRLGIHGSNGEKTITGSYGQFEGLQGVAVIHSWAKKSPGTATTPDYPLFTDIPTTQFPQPNGLGQTWDPELVREMAAQEAYEARYIVQSYDRGGLLLRAPNADLVHDPRWGRSEESFGEDPYLDGVMAAAVARGLQGDDKKYWTTVSIAKHFFANSNETGREETSSNFSQALLHDYYTKPFRMAIEEGGGAGLMVSFNEVNGTPMTANPLVPQLLQQWGFHGIVDTDRDAMWNLVRRYHLYPDVAHAVVASMKNGVNDFLDQRYGKALHDAVAQKLITEQEIDADLRPLLHVLLKLGVLDAPGTVNPYSHIRKGSVPVPWESDAAKQLALRTTVESIVLLKNAGPKPVLPIDKASVRSIALLGEGAGKVYGGGYVGMPPFAVTPVEGMRAAAGAGVKIAAATGHDEAVALAKASDVAVVFVGSDPNCKDEKFGNCSEPSGGREAIDRKTIVLPVEQEQMVRDVMAVNPRTVVVVVSGFPFAIAWEAEHVPAIVHMAHSSEQEGAGLAAVLFGDADPGGHLTVTWPAKLEDLPPMLDYNLADGRTYMYPKAKALFPFGYGLSYTQFAYSNLRVSKELRAGGMLRVSADVANTGGREGNAVVQMYVQRAGGPEELAAFSRVRLGVGEKKSVVFEVKAKELERWSEKDSREVLGRGVMKVMVGESAMALPLVGSVVVR